MLSLYQSDGLLLEMLGFVPLQHTGQIIVWWKISIFIIHCAHYLSSHWLIAYS